MSTPTILVDMDGVLADFDGALWDRCTGYPEHFQFDIEGLHEQRHRFLTDHLSVDWQVKLMRSVVEGDGWFRELPVIEGAQEGMALLAEHAEVWICSKPLEASKSCASDKFAWIKRHFPEFEGRLILAPDKWMVKGDVLLDDAPKKRYLHLAEWAPVIYEHAWNTGTGPEAYDPRIPRFNWNLDPLSLVAIAKQEREKA